MDVVKKKCGVECEALQYSTIKKHDDADLASWARAPPEERRNQKKATVPGIIENTW